MIYGITATVAVKRNGWLTTHHTPTFYLDSQVQGILNKEHAKVIAAGIVNPTQDSNIKVEVTAYETDR
jgi:hypothetical protein